MSDKMFDYCIGNPPYQENTKNAGDRPNPVYDKFMDAAFEVAGCVELIHPARFLFNGGQTPKAWNNKMLNDEHFKVLSYEPDASRIFSNTEIKGGVAITLRNSKKDFGAIGTFTVFPELNKIIHKVARVSPESERLDTIIASQGLFRFTEKFLKDNLDVASNIGKGTGSKIVSSIMPKAPLVFLDNKPENGDYIRFLGRIRNNREYKWIKKEYVVDNKYIEKYKLFIPEANNSGKFGETLTEPIVGFPGDGSSDTYLSAGPFNSLEEANNLAKYQKTKFFRALLGAKKVTQHCPPHVWKMIPLQDFTSASDIDWSKTVNEIDLYLYRKYGFSNEEIDFIEINVKEME